MGNNKAVCVNDDKTMRRMLDSIVCKYSRSPAAVHTHMARGCWQIQLDGVVGCDRQTRLPGRDKNTVSAGAIAILNWNQKTRGGSRV